MRFHVICLCMKQNNVKFLNSKIILITRLQIIIIDKNEVEYKYLMLSTRANIKHKLIVLLAIYVRMYR